MMKNGFVFFVIHYTVITFNIKYILYISYYDTIFIFLIFLHLTFFISDGFFYIVFHPQIYFFPVFSIHFFLFPKPV